MIEQYQEALNAATQRIMDIQRDLDRLEDNEINRDRISELRLERAIQRQEQRRNEQIVNAYQQMLEGIEDYRELSNINPRSEDDRVRLAELLEQREADIQDARRILPEDLQNDIRNRLGEEMEENREMSTTEPTLTPVIENTQEQTETITPQMDTAQPSGNDTQTNAGASSTVDSSPSGNDTSSILDSNFDPSSIPFEEFQRRWREEANRYQDDEEKLKELNNLYNHVKQQHRNRNRNANTTSENNPTITPDQNTQTNKQTTNKPNYDPEVFDLDQNGNLIFFDGTNVPRPRNRKPYESDDDYNNFLANYYKDLQDKGVFTPNPNYASPDHGKTPNNTIPGLPGPTKQPIGIEQKPPGPGTNPPGPGTNPPSPGTNPPGPGTNPPGPGTNPPGPGTNPPGPGTNPPGGQQNPSNNHEKKVEEIVRDIVKNIDQKYIKARTGKRYSSANIKVRKAFVDEVCNGHMAYNVVSIAGGIAHLPVNLAKKAAGNLALLFRRKEKREVEKLRKAVLSIPDAEAETLYHEYAGWETIQQNYPTALNMFLGERIGNWVLKQLEPLDKAIDKGRKKAVKDIQQLDNIDLKLQDPNLSAQEKTNLQNQRNQLLNGQAQAIDKIRKDIVKANKFCSHGYSEDIKAAMSKMNVVGGIFAKSHGLDKDLLTDQGNIREREQRAIETGDNEAALRAFIELEKLMVDNTEVKGHHSTGKKNYHDNYTQAIDFRDQIFAQRVFTTLKVGASAGVIAKAINNMITTDQILNQHQQNVQTVNAANQQTIDRVHDIGNEITGKSDAFSEGIKAQIAKDNISLADLYERYGLDKSDWTLASDAYQTMDDIGHAAARKLYETTHNQLNTIAQELQAGNISGVDALEAIGEVSNHSNGLLNDLVNEYMPTFTQYAQTHPQFDLEALGNSMSYLMDHPDVIDQMNQGMVDVVNLGGELSNTTLESVNAIQNLPGHEYAIFMGALTAACEARQVEQQTNPFNREKERRGNLGRQEESELQQMLRGYEKPASQQQAQQQRAA